MPDRTNLCSWQEKLFMMLIDFEKAYLADIKEKMHPK